MKFSQKEDLKALSNAPLMRQADSKCNDLKPTENSAVFNAGLQFFNYEVLLWI